MEGFGSATASRGDKPQIMCLAEDGDFEFTGCEPNVCSRSPQSDTVPNYGLGTGYPFARKAVAPYNFERRAWIDEANFEVECLRAHHRGQGMASDLAYHTSIRSALVCDSRSISLPPAIFSLQDETVGKRPMAPEVVPIVKHPMAFGRQRVEPPRVCVPL